ncbi:MAG: ATP-binding protein, partial [Candidatus Anstonellales archaeon]
MLKDILLLLNQHWEHDFFYNYPFKRHIYKKLVSYLSTPLILTINGPRRVGKTVLMKQLINHLISEGFSRKNILFFSFDEEIDEPIEIIKTWEEIIGKKVKGSNYFIFFDEVQNLNNWASKIKILHDNIGVKIFLSGSASLEIKKGHESLAGRSIDISINPLSFDEYLMLSGKAHSDILEQEWENYKFYMHRQLPGLALHSSLDSHDYVSSIVKKVIYEDAKKFYSINEQPILEGIFKTICRDPGQIMAISDIAKDFGISRITASHYINALEKSFLIRKLYNFSNNPRKIEVRAKKYYPYYTTLIDYVSQTDLSKIAETEVAWKLNAEFFWNDRGKEIDFIKNSNAIEVKMRKTIDKNDIKWLIKTELKIKRKIVITMPETKVRLDKKHAKG